MDTLLVKIPTGKHRFDLAEHLRMASRTQDQEVGSGPWVSAIKAVNGIPQFFEALFNDGFIGGCHSIAYLRVQHFEERDTTATIIRNRSRLQDPTRYEALEPSEFPQPLS